MQDKTVVVVVTNSLAYVLQKPAQETDNQGNKHLAGMNVVFILLQLRRWSVLPIYENATLKAHISF